MKATNLPQWAWRDPLEVAERRESISCEGCLFKVVALGIKQCVKHKGRLGDGMYRCVDYRESKR